MPTGNSRSKETILIRRKKLKKNVKATRLVVGTLVSVMPLFNF